MRVLGVETSCDETGVAIYDSEKGLLGHALYSQVDLHADYGGVVPELASRDHVRKILPLVRELCQQTQSSLRELEAVAYTAGPGLSGALMVGAVFGRTLAWALGIPAIGVHHMEGHLLAPLLETPAPQFPFVALLVSGGHTQLMAVRGIGQYELLGESIDDAAGEAFDKVAKMLQLGYPGGPAVAKLAEQGDSLRFDFPRPMLDRPGLDFSFSGLKTSVLTALNQTEDYSQKKADIAASFQAAAVDTLTRKCLRALTQTGFKQLVVAGGVSANKHLRETLAASLSKHNASVFYPALPFCTDNGAMIAFAGCQRLLAGEMQGMGIDVKPRWPMSELLPAG